MASYEIIEAYNTKGMGLKRPILKHIAHKRGIPHSTIHIWIRTKEGIILQQRSKNKDTYPLFWDVSVAGHIDYNEAPKIAAQREAKEELGIDIQIDELIELGTFYEAHYHPRSRIIDREFKTVFYYNYNGSIKDLNQQKEEVEEIQTVELNDLTKSIKSNVPYKMVNHKREYFELVISQLT